MKKPLTTLAVAPCAHTSTRLPLRFLLPLLCLCGFAMGLLLLNKSPQASPLPADNRSPEIPSLPFVDDAAQINFSLFGKYVAGWGMSEE